jgi:copper(I)-binding protein
MNRRTPIAHSPSNRFREIRPALRSPLRALFKPLIVPRFKPLIVPCFVARFVPRFTPCFALRLMPAAAAGILTALMATSAAAVLSVNEPWVRIAPDGRNAELFVNLRSSEPATLTGVDSFAARRAVLESAARKTLSGLELPANTAVAVKGTDARVRLIGLVRPIKLGEYVPVTLFLRGPDGATQRVFVNAEVRHHSPTEDETSGHAHSHAPQRHPH